MFRLALRLGKTKAELLRDIGGARELGQWMAYFDIEPFQSRDEEMFAALMAGIHNSSGNFKKPFKQADFMPSRERAFERKEVKRQRVIDNIRAVFGK